MKFNVKSLLKDKMVLYIVLFFAVTNFFGYVLLDNYDAVITMFLVGLLSSYFSKNMIVILLSAIIGGTIVTGATTVNTGFKEGFKEGAVGKPDHKCKDGKCDGGGKGDKGDGSVKGHEDGKGDGVGSKKDGKGGDGSKGGDKDSKETFTDGDDEEEGGGVSGATEETDDAAAGKDPTEVAMGNLDKILGGNSATSLIDNQSQLMKNMENLEPLMTQASSMLEKLNTSGLIDKVGSLANNLNVGK